MKIVIYTAQNVYLQTELKLSWVSQLGSSVAIIPKSMFLKKGLSKEETLEPKFNSNGLSFVIIRGVYTTGKSNLITRLLTI